MKAYKSLTVKKNVPLDLDLTRKFQEASKKKASVQDFVNEFLGQFLSENTRNSYMKDMKFFFDFLRSGGEFITHPNDIKSYHFQLYRDKMLAEKKASATINRRLVAVRSFMNWAVASRLIESNPLDVVKLPKVQTVSPTVAFEDVEVLRMISRPDLTTHKGRMNRMAMVLLFNLGLRRAELIAIKLEDLIQDRGHIVLRVRGKGDKIRLIPLNDFVLNEIKRYIDVLEEHDGVKLNGEDYLLQTSAAEKNKRPIDGSTIYRIIDKYSRELGINKSVSPHSCRATVISHLLDTQQIAIRDVATFAGHANITTTERYDKRRNNLDKSAAYEVNYGVELVREG